MLGMDKSDGNRKEFKGKKKREQVLANNCMAEKERESCG